MTEIGLVIAILFQVAMFFTSPTTQQELCSSVSQVVMACYVDGIKLPPRLE